MPAVRRIDTGTDQLVGDAIGVGDVPENIAVKPDGAEAYATNTHPRRPRHRDGISFSLDNILV